MYPNVLSAFYGQPWAILPSKLSEIRSFLEFQARGGKLTAEQVREVTAGRRDNNSQMVGRVAVVSCFGILSQRGQGADISTQMVSAQELGATLDALNADRGVKCIALVIDSPGGSVFGISELGAKIASNAKEKKIVAVADSLAASAAYWIASQCSEIVVTPGGQVGSIGVIAAHEDTSAADAAAGVKTTLVTSSQYKAENDPSTPLSDEAKAEIQRQVNAYHGMFIKAVASGRSATEHRVETTFGQGRMVMAKEAVEKGMADRVATLEATLSRMGAFEGGARAQGPLPVGAKVAAARARAVQVEG